MVGETLASKLVQLGHEVRMGSRAANNEKAAAWVKNAGKGASQGTFADAVAFGEICFLCAKGDVALDVVRAAGLGAFKSKILVDVSNPLDFSHGMPPSLIPDLSNTNSLGEAVQKLLPEAFVVKTLNTVTASVMISPQKLKEDTALFVCGNDAAAKGKVTELLRSFGWKTFVDLGDITAARATESYLLLWLRTWGALGTPEFNLKIVR
jgi:predicted dinucleotide-binding enzyme